MLLFYIKSDTFTTNIICFKCFYQNIAEAGVMKIIKMIENFKVEV